MKNYYEILEVNNKASFETIKKVFKMQIKMYHPDIVSEDKKEYAENKVKELNEAYDVLSDENKRKEYDEQLKNETNSSEHENLLKEQIKNLKMQLEEKEQIIDHFLGGLDLSEFENTIRQEHQKFKDEEIYDKDNFTNNQSTNYNDNDNNYYYNENPKNTLEKIQNFFNPNRPYKNIYEHYIHLLIVFIIKILGIILALIAFFTITSILTNTNVFEILFNVFFSSK